MNINAKYILVLRYKIFTFYMEYISKTLFLYTDEVLRHHRAERVAEIQQKLQKFWQQGSEVLL